MKHSLLLAAMLAASTARAQFATAVDSNGSNLANSLVGTGANIQNVQLTCAGQSTGFYNGGASTNLGLSNGVVLATGLVSAIADSAQVYVGAAMNTYGDPYLDDIVETFTFDACVFEFDVTVAGDTLMMDYVFASDEYPEYQCTAYNDAFAFQLSGPNPSGGTYNQENIARLPGYDAYVTINNVNDHSIYGSDYCYFDYSDYYVDNANGLDIVFDGFTVPLTAKAATIPGATYHMRFAIADTRDIAFDSAVFLKSGSLKSSGATGVSNIGNTLSTLMPNPTTGATVLENQTGKPIQYTVLNMMGQTLLKGEVGAGTATTIDLSSFGTGDYLVRSSGGAAVTTQRIEVR